MPKDKSATHEKLIPIVQREFLEYGFDRASVNHIAELAGMSAAGLYRHYRNKEDMFASLVEDTVKGFDVLCRKWEKGCTDMEALDPFGTEWVNELLDYVYEHFTEFRLLICCASGSQYENYEEELIQREESSSRKYAEQLRENGRQIPEVTDRQWHLVSTLYVRAVLEIIHHNMTRNEAEEHMQFVAKLLYPGMRKLFEKE